MARCYIASILTVLANGNQSVAILNAPELLQVTVGFLSRKIVIFVSAALEKGWDSAHSAGNNPRGW